MQVFFRGAGDARVGQADGQHARNQVGQGGDAVHEYPEAREGGRCCQDAERDVSEEILGEWCFGMRLIGRCCECN